MKIKNISCTQFAGIRDKNISFNDGINIVYGKNESGKSTIVNLISRTLFQKAKLDGRSDKEFRELYFPGSIKGSTAVGDFADGKVSFETSKGTYTLAKEWGGDARCTLFTPDGVIRDQKTIDGILREALLYGEGVYSDMLLSSQKNSDQALQTLLDAAQKTDAKQEITDVVSVAVAESDGISMNSVEQAIEKKIKEISGSHWDCERNMPARKSGRWSVGVGEVLKAYYELEDAQAVLDEISKLEFEADKTASEYTEKDIDVKKAEEEFDKFNTFASLLTMQSERREKIKKLELEIKGYTAVIEEWPKMIEALKIARDLELEKTRRDILDKYTIAKKQSNEILEYREKIKVLVCPTKDDITNVKNALRIITNLENKLCGMNLAAKIKMLSGNTVEVKSLRTGEIIKSFDEDVSITEAVTITIPDVMEMQLTPADVNSSEIKEQIEEQKAIITSIYEKYKVENIEKLEALEKEYVDINLKIDNLNNRLLLTLGDISFEDLETSAQSIIDAVREEEDISREILNICGNAELTRFITEKETLIKKNECDYGSMELLKNKIFDTTNELEKAKSSISSSDDIPDEYLQISDPDAHLEELRNEVKMKQQLREKTLTDKTAAASRLETYKENITGDPIENKEKAQRRFDEQKELLEHWNHIKAVFYEQKEKLSGSPMKEISENFTRYLSLISSGKVSSEFPEQDKLNMNIYSDNRLLDYGKLSEGTKETVSLAFRLAVLDHMFPDGGGVVVFDDPFTDMDNERAKQACELVKDFASRHQVIFLTCKDEYLEMLDGNVIRI